MNTQTKLLMVMLWLALSTPVVHAATFNWTNTGTQPNNFDRTDNWSPNGVPGEGDVARFDAVGSNDLRVIAPNLNTGRLEVVGDAEVTITRPQGLQLRSGNSIALLVSGEDPTLQIGPPAFGGPTEVFARGVRVGHSANEQGTLILTDGASLTTDDGFFSVGEEGTGALEIRSGASLETTSDGSTFGNFVGRRQGSVGTAVVTGADSNWLNHGILTIGAEPESTGRIDVASGATLTLVNQQSNPNFPGELAVGLRGNATLNIVSGGQVFSVTAFIGTIAGEGFARVNGSGSRWTISGNASIGREGRGLLAIETNGLVEVGGSITLSSPTLNLGRGSLELTGGTLRAGRLVRGNGTSNFNWTAGTLEITGLDGLTIGAGQFFGPSLALDANQNLGVTNTLTIDAGATLFADGGLSSGGLVNNGDLILSSTTVDGPVTNAAGANVTVIGDVTFNGPVDGPGGFFGPGTAIFNGGMSPGASPAVVPFEGNLAFGDANTLTMELGGLADGEFDRLVIGGDAALDGALVVNLIDDFTPQFGDAFEILNVAGTLSGQFAGLDEGMLVTATGGRQFQISYSGGDGNDVVLTAAPPVLPGDYNADGVVDAADYTVWRDLLGQAAALPNETVTLGMVTIEDYDEWTANFGSTLGSDSLSNASVPEPHTWVLLSFAGMLFLYQFSRMK